ncbi:hypothetical protein EDB85DRAFT_1890429 [Lactarius pseudohatsudake]|nr:hypothetical protein EDB85DRAFT_1890429 [Lactarius pseudohatsudake]
MHSLSFLALASVFSARVLAASVHSTRSSGPPGWTSYYCIEDNRYSIGVPLLTGAGYADPAGMTIEKCAAFCDSQSVPYRFMGLTDGFQCTCDNFFENIFEVWGNNAQAYPCNTPCPGDPHEKVGCGGQYLASTYQKVNSTFIVPIFVPSVGLWNGLGCYSDSVSARALQVMVDAGNTTVESCVTACQAQGFSLAGVEFGKECWCGSQLQHGSRFITNDNYDGIQYGVYRRSPDEPSCIMNCQGDPSESCGGADRLILYNFTGTYPLGASVVVAVNGWTSQGCYSDSTSSRTLERRVDAGNVTVESCSFSIAGLEYAQECWCGNEIKSPGVPTSQSACSQACIGDDIEVCGQLFEFLLDYESDPFFDIRCNVQDE